MTQVTLMTTEGPVVCDRMQSRPQDVAPGDVLVCEHTGFHHVHSVVRRGNVVDIFVCEDVAHIYHHNDLVEIARPQVVGN